MMSSSDIQRTSVSADTKNRPHRVSIIIPAYNEEDTIGDILPELAKFVNDYDWEVIVVDDASEDQTVKIVEKFKVIKLLTHTYNKGYGASLKSGVRVATND